MLRNNTAATWIQNETENVKLLENHEHWESVPLLNVLPIEKVMENTMVRFQGMVQDMCNPEYFFEHFEVNNDVSGETTMKCGKYFDSTLLLDNETVNYDGKKNVTKERHTMVLISVPAVNDWVYSYRTETNKSLLLTQQFSHKPSPAVKRTLNDENQQESKKLCVENGTSTVESTSAVNRELNSFPLPQRKGMICHAKIYNDADNLKLNDVVEVIGFFAAAKTDCKIAKQSDEDEEMDVDISSVSTAVPRIHCVSYRKLMHQNPLLPNATMDSDEKLTLRKETLILFKQLLLGDELAAQYLLFNLVSRIFGRVSLQPLGKFALNITNTPSTERPNYVKEVYDFIESLLPKSHYFPMTLENMNKTNYVPKKNYETNSLISGLLQLSTNTHLVLDETALKNGTLEAAGVVGVTNLIRTIDSQTVTYDFGFYPMEFDTDIIFLIFSEGKTMLSADFRVRLCYDAETLRHFSEVLTAAKHFFNTDMLNKIRKYLTAIQYAEYSVTDDMLELVQQDYVVMRKNDVVTGVDLQNILIVARMLSLSSGKTKLDRETWEEACVLEKRRKAALLLK